MSGWEDMLELTEQLERMTGRLDRIVELLEMLVGVEPPVEAGKGEEEIVRGYFSDTTTTK